MSSVKGIIIIARLPKGHAVNTLEEILQAARSHDRITALQPSQADGAEGFFQAFATFAPQYPALTPLHLREAVRTYLASTHSLSREYVEGAEVASEVIKELSS